MGEPGYQKDNVEHVLEMEPIRLLFTIRSTYDLFPPPNNHMTWEKSDDTKCGLCSEPGNLEPILFSCNGISHGVTIRYYEIWPIT